MSPDEINQYIGIPYKKAGNDINGFDCWGFVRYIQKEYYNLELPIISVDSSNMLSVMRNFKSNDEIANWEEQQTPSEGCAVLLTQSANPSHVGVWTNNGLLHAVKGMGVIFSSKRNLQATGWSNLKYYQHKIKEIA